MNCEVLELPVLAVEQYQLREVMRCILHTILFNRALGNVRPRDVDSELFDLSYVQCGDASVERTVEDRVSALCAWVEKHPGKNVTVLVSFYEKRAKSNALWFSKGEERLYWEQWRVHLDLVQLSNRSEPDPEATRRKRHSALEAALQAGLLALVKLVNEKREHIPPVSSSDVVSFPYEITLPSDTDAPFGLDMFKRVVLNSTPPAMLG